MTYTLFKCDGCGKEERTEKYTLYPTGWTPLQLMAFALVAEHHACSRECSDRALLTALEGLYALHERQQAETAAKRE